MNKLRLKLQETKNVEILDREQLKAVLGGSDCAAISHSCSTIKCCEGTCGPVELCKW